MVRVLVCGGRDFCNIAFAHSHLDRLHAERRFTALLQGGASGADSIARDWAVSRPEIRRFVSRADWDRYGPAAGPIRNKRMLLWKPDLVVAFPGGTGTADMVSRARRAGVEVIEVSYGHG